jgi:putative transposase
MLRIAKETGHGYTRILGELKRLGVNITRQTVKNILHEAGLEPGPNRGPGSWSEFLRAHGESLWQCDFFSTKAWTPRGVLEYFAIVFIHVGSRRVWISPATVQPDGPWAAQQARNFAIVEGDAPEKAIVFHDRDAKFTAQFRAILTDSGFKATKLPVRAPNLRPHVERFVQAAKQEALEPLIVLGERHLNHILGQYMAYHNRQRCHSSLEFRTPTTRGQPFPTTPPERGTVAKRERLGGVLKWYERADPAPGQRRAA